MFYSILKQLVATALKIYFRKIYILNQEKIDDADPLIIAANHPMAFCDACLLACFLDRPLHFLVRGDVFVKKWRWFFEWTNQIPIYRFRDGFSNMRKNANTFALVHEKLGEGAAVLIFAEGDTQLRKHLGTIQKGPARIAFGAIESGVADSLKILPIGINYTDGSKFRSDVFLSIGEGIPLSQYDLTTLEAKKSATKEVTAQLYNALMPHVIHCNDLLREQAHRQQTNLRPLKCRWPILDTSQERFRFEKGLAEELNAMSNEDVTESMSVILPSKGPSFISILVICLFMPLALLGFILNAIPFYLAKKIAKSRVKVIEFYAPIRIGLTMILEMIWLFILLVIGLLTFGPISLLVILLIPMLGYLTILIRESITDL